MKMGMNPDDFFECFVYPNYNDFCENEDDIRKGFNSVVSISHMADNYYYYYKRNDPDKVNQFNKLTDFKIHLSSQTPYFNDIQSLANAHKHLYTASQEQYVTVESGGAVMIEEIDDNISGISDHEQSTDGKYVVMYTKKDSSKVRLKESLEKTVAVWQNILGK